MDNVRILIEKGIPPFATPQKWADLGCGNGVFTQALACLLPTGSSIIAIDKTSQKLPEMWGNSVNIHFEKADFTSDNLPLSELHGILMANSLHFVKDKKTLIRKLEKHLSDAGFWLVVEYEHYVPNQWSPFRCRLRY